MKPCPFCGMKVDLDDPDVLYPNGTGWLLRPNGRKSYHSFRDVPKEHWCYTIHCPTTAGGCSAEISGNSAKEAIEKWNRRSNNEFLNFLQQEWYKLNSAPNKPDETPRDVGFRVGRKAELIALITKLSRLGYSEFDRAD